mmetsp:Transcript_39534/g.45010  ORF Transcript_39534/g.45010 Transcript_39534/m.45010 type:complete len:320 (-) Transcript_39534:75-1034(-)
MGSKLEFKRSVSQAQVTEALKMPGGGPFHLIPGQITDDGELTMCLLHGLTVNSLEEKFSMTPIMKNYQGWILSRPFDIGNTTSSALRPLFNANRHGSSVKDDELFEMCKAEAEKYNGHSQSNGCLMRQSPLALYCSNLSDEDTNSIVLQDTEVTHSNQAVFVACQCYSLAIKHLINTGGDRAGAYDLAKQHGTQENSPIKDWWQLIESEDYIDSVRHMGWAKIAFSHAFRALKKGSNYKDALEDVLRYAGDTDTNACILGGLVGAAVGIDEIPSEYKEKAYNWNPMNPNAMHVRPAQFAPSLVPDAVLTILKNAPTDLS